MSQAQRKLSDARNGTVPSPRRRSLIRSAPLHKHRVKQAAVYQRRPASSHRPQPRPRRSGCRILIDENTRSGLDDGIVVEAQGELLVKGKTEPVKVYAVHVDSLVAEGV
jgi:hypothetical protein